MNRIDQVMQGTLRGGFGTAYTFAIIWLAYGWISKPALAVSVAVTIIGVAHFAVRFYRARRSVIITTHDKVTALAWGVTIAIGAGVGLADLASGAMTANHLLVAIPLLAAGLGAVTGVTYFAPRLNGGPRE